MSIKINVGGTIFETQEITLRKISYFNDLLNDTNLSVNDVLFVDRPAHMFKHVLALAIDNTYKYPKKYLSELGFYGVTCDVKSVYDPSLKTIEHLDILERHIDRKINDLEYSVNKSIAEMTENITNLSNEIIKKNDTGVCEWKNCYDKKSDDNYCETHNCRCDYYVDGDYCERYTSYRNRKCENHYDM